MLSYEIITMKKFYEVFLTYPNGATSHYRKSHDKARIIKELKLLIAQRELLVQLAIKLTINDKGSVLFECHSKDFNEESLSLIKWRQQGGNPQYPNKVNLRISDDMKEDITMLGNGSFTDGVREMYELWAKKHKTKDRKNQASI